MSLPLNPGNSIVSYGRNCFHEYVFNIRADFQELSPCVNREQQALAHNQFFKKIKIWQVWMRKRWGMRPKTVVVVVIVIVVCFINTRSITVRLMIPTELLRILFIRRFIHGFWRPWEKRSPIFVGENKQQLRASCIRIQHEGKTEHTSNSIW